MNSEATKDALRRQLLENVEGLASEAASVERIHCSITNGASAPLFRARYAVSQPASTGAGPLILESIGRNQPGIRIEASNASTSFIPAGPGNGHGLPPVAIVEPDDGRSWQDVELSVVCEASPVAMGSEVVLLPDHLPLPVVFSTAADIPVPLVPVTFDSSIAAMIRGGIPYHPTLPWDVRVGEMCQAALVLNPSEFALDADLDERTVRLAESLGRYLGRTVDFRLVRLATAPKGAAQLAGFVLDTNYFGRTSGKKHIGDYLPLISHLTGIWWGGGCRVSGPNGRDIEQTIRFAVAAHLSLRGVSSREEIELVLSDFERNPRLAPAGRLCRKLGAGSFEGLEPLQRLTAAHWGTSIPQARVITALAPALDSFR